MKRTFDNTVKKRINFHKQVKFTFFKGRKAVRFYILYQVPYLYASTLSNFVFKINVLINKFLNSQKCLMGHTNFVGTFVLKYKLMLKFLYFLDDSLFFYNALTFTFLLDFDGIDLIIAVVIRLDVQYIENLLVLKRLAFLSVGHWSFDSLRFTRWLYNSFLLSLFGLFFLMMRFFIDSFILKLLYLMSLLSYFLFFDELFKFVLFLIRNLLLFRFEFFLSQTQIKLVTVFDHISERIGFRKLVATALSCFSILVLFLFIIQVVGVLFNNSKSHLQNAL